MSSVTLACRKRRLNRTVLRMRPWTLISHVKASTCIYGTIKIPPCLKNVNAEQRPKFCNVDASIWMKQNAVYNKSVFIWILTYICLSEWRWFAKIHVLASSKQSCLQCTFLYNNRNFNFASQVSDSLTFINPLTDWASVYMVCPDILHGIQSNCT